MIRTSSSYLTLVSLCILVFHTNLHTHTSSSVQAFFFCRKLLPFTWYPCLFRLAYFTHFCWKEDWREDKHQCVCVSVCKSGYSVAYDGLSRSTLVKTNVCVCGQQIVYSRKAIGSRVTVTTTTTSATLVLCVHACVNAYLGVQFAFNLLYFFFYTHSICFHIDWYLGRHQHQSIVWLRPLNNFGFFSDSLPTRSCLELIPLFFIVDVISSFLSSLNTTHTPQKVIFLSRKPILSSLHFPFFPYPFSSSEIHHPTSNSQTRFASISRWRRPTSLTAIPGYHHHQQH